MAIRVQFLFAYFQKREEMLPEDGMMAIMLSGQAASFIKMLYVLL